MKKIKILIGIIGGGIALCLAVMLVCDALVRANAEGKTYSNVSDIHETKVGLLLGSTPQTRIGRRTNHFFTYRIDAAESLYKAGKIHFILISGDSHSLDGVDETVCMRDSLIARGIPKSAMALDGEGYRTINSIVRARNVYKVHTFTIISQRFHTERALYLAEHLGLDVGDIQGFNAREPRSKFALITYAREYLARVKMFMDILWDKIF